MLGFPMRRRAGELLVREAELVPAGQSDGEGGHKDSEEEEEEEEEGGGGGRGSFAFGAKIAFLVSKITELRSEDPGAKIIVFSQWNDYLHIVETALELAHESAESP